ncbi:MAG: DNA ligase D [Coriobacteriia bacterium]|nr:DNA ligase D [Coriobacteriia bacterium]
MGDLDRYRDKRHFGKTPEPEGEEAPEVRSDAGPETTPRLYVIQKHAARRLHYDLRLELGGVLLSWAVPKGPSLDPSQRRLAVRVEDHPVEYGSFEGVIPEGEYGAGTVMVWDRGTWQPVFDPVEGLDKGHLKFDLSGEKLVGRWALVRLKPREGESGQNWLLIKDRDEHARDLDDYDVLAARPDSAASGRDLEQISAGGAPPTAGGGDAGPFSAEIIAPDSRPGGVALGSATRDSVALDGATLAPMPVGEPMQLATLVDRPPEGPEWIHEIKYDGYRLRIATQDGRARLLTRSAQDWTERFPEIAEAAESFSVGSVLLDGEVVVFGAHGVPDFGALQEAVAKRRTSHATYMAFDLLYLNGRDLREFPLLKRKELANALLATLPHDSPLRYADHITGRGEEFHREACTLALEGSVSKRGDRPYRAGRTREWQKVKCLRRQEFVVGGFTEGEGGRGGFGALLLGYHDLEGGLRYAGRVGTGFTERNLEDLRAKLDALEIDGSPFDGSPELTGRVAHWVRPELVVEVTFQEWTRDGLLRHPSFHGQRIDKPAADVMREESAAAAVGEPGAVVVAGTSITNPDKVLYPATDLSGATSKLDLARYYESIAPHMLPHISGRPLTLVRCPHGREGDCFYQKHPEPRGFPSAIHTVEIAEKNGVATYLYVDDVPGIVALVQLGTLEIHAWQSRVDDPEKPDQIVLDLDPGPDVTWRRIVESAQLVREALSAIGLTAFAKTTGGKGLHLVAPIEREHTFDKVRGIAHALVDHVAEHDPRNFTAKMAKTARGGHVFVDYLRNSHGATAVCPFSTRARPGAPVAVPVTWEELEAAEEPLVFDTISAVQRVARMGLDPWMGFEDGRVRLGEAR